MDVGERWAYRKHMTDPVTCVEVLRVGTSRPARVRVKFLDDDYEGSEEWVPPARLKVLWDQVGPWRLRDERWTAVREPSAHIRDTAEERVADLVFDHVSGREPAQLVGRSDAGVLKIPNVDALAADVGLDRDDLTGDPLAFFDDDGSLVVPWRVTRQIAERLAKLHADTLLAELAADEEEDRREATWGYVSDSGTYIEPEICAEVAQKYQPGRELARAWCGRDAQERYDELRALRTEVVRLGQLVERAIAAVRAAGDTDGAEALEQELGIPLEVLRQVGKPRR